MCGCFFVALLVVVGGYGRTWLRLDAYGRLWTLVRRSMYAQSDYEPHTYNVNNAWFYFCMTTQRSTRRTPNCQQNMIQSMKFHKKYIAYFLVFYTFGFSEIGLLEKSMEKIRLLKLPKFFLELFLF